MELCQMCRVKGLIPKHSIYREKLPRSEDAGLQHKPYILNTGTVEEGSPLSYPDSTHVSASEVAATQAAAEAAA